MLMGLAENSGVPRGQAKKGGSINKEPRVPQIGGSGILGPAVNVPKARKGGGFRKACCVVCGTRVHRTVVRSTYM